MTAELLHTARLQLGDFEVPAIPDGYRLTSVEVSEHKARTRGKQFPVARYCEAVAIEKACEHVLHDIGWARAVITLWLERISDGAEGFVTYVCDHDEWEVTLADAEGGAA